MKKRAGLYGICLLRAIGAMEPSSKVIKLRRYMKARRAFLSNIKIGETNLTAISIAIFDAAYWDKDRYILGMRALSECLKEHKSSVEDLI
ncbi:MAG: hypothetical protein WA087_03225 [Candidatus Saccharimonadales bacterium]